MRHFCLIFFVFFTSLVLAQEKLSSSNARALSAYQRSNIAISQKLYSTAIRDLEEALRNDPNFLEAKYRLADVYKIQKQYQSSLDKYLEVEAANPQISKHITYEIAECYFYLHQYTQALERFTTYSTLPDLSEKRQKELSIYLRNSAFAAEAIKNPVSYNPKNLGANINTSNQEYLPNVTADDSLIIFTRRTNQEDFYQSARQADGSWTRAESLSRNINTSGNEGAQCISPDGQFLFFAGCGRADGFGKCDLYYSKKIGNEWSVAENLGEPINSKYWESQPSLSADGQYLYFVSDRPGGLGAYDIYQSKYLGKGKWSSPQNMGPNINTSGTEFSPFIHADNQTFYFSSDGWPGFGENDIFLSRKDKDKRWTKPTNLGYPINTSEEESSLYISNNGSSAYFASAVLKGFGGIDLYEFELPLPVRPKWVSFVKGTVYDKETRIVVSANVEIMDLRSNDTVAITQSNAANGQFLSSLPAGNTYAFNVNAPGYLFYSDQFILEDKQQLSPYLLQIPLEPIRAGAKVTLRNIFYESNSFKLKNESKYELLKLLDFMKQNPAVRIEVEGHTDNVGADANNQTLSTNRAKSVYDYLVRQGIAADRISYKGYGKTQPVDSNATEKGRANNRRTEVRIR